MDILNLGAGYKPVTPVDGGIVVNHDLTLDPERPYVTVAHDLNDLPWPWEDNSFDLIVACAVFEHLRNTLIDTVNECWRILRPGGVLHMKLPYWDSDTSYRDPTHYWRFSLRTCDLFDPDTKYGHDYRFYPTQKWKIIQPAKLNNAGTSFAIKMRVRK